MGGWRGRGVKKLSSYIVCEQSVGHIPLLYPVHNHCSVVNCRVVLVWREIKNCLNPNTDMIYNTFLSSLQYV